MLRVFVVCLVFSFAYANKNEMEERALDSSAKMKKDVMNIQRLLDQYKADHDFQVKPITDVQQKALRKGLKKRMDQRRVDKFLQEDSRSTAAASSHATAILDGFLLKNMFENVCLDVYQGYKWWNTGKIYIFDCHGGDNQKWIWVNDTIRSKHDMQCLTVAHETAGQQAKMATCDGSESQTWYRENLRIHSRPNGGGMCLGSTEDKAVVMGECKWETEFYWDAYETQYPPIPAVNADEVRHSAQQAAAAYCNPDVIQEGDAGVVGGLTAEKLTLVKFIECKYKGTDKASDVEGYVAKPIDGDRTKPVVLGVRGTASGVDAVQDIKIAMVAPTAEDGTRLAQDVKAKIHLGFRNQWRGMRDEAIAELEKLLAEGYTTVRIVGHSLGGAVASLMALDLHYNLNKNGVNFHTNGGDIRLFTFGSPRVGNDEFVEEFNHKVPNSWRIVNDQDPVACIPTEWIGFDHISHVLLNLEDWDELRDEGWGTYTWHYDMDDEDNCGYFWQWRVGDHMMDAYRDKLKALPSFV